MNYITAFCFLFITLSFTESNVQYMRDAEFVSPRRDYAVERFGTKREDYFLDLIRAIESNRGENTRHVLMTKGTHKGTRAVGQWGLMPLTILSLIQKENDVIMRRLRGYNVHHFVNNEIPFEIQLHLARKLARKILYKANNDLTLGAYYWYHGMYKEPTKEELLTNDYVHQFLYRLSRNICYTCNSHM